MRRALGLLVIGTLVTFLGACGSTSTTNGDTSPEAAPATTAPAPPTRIRIPALQVDSAITEELGLQPDGKMEVPPDAKDTGWFVYSPVPGQKGPSVLAAHVNWKGVDGPFARLHELKAGDEVLVEGKDGAELTFTVTLVEKYAKDAFPHDTIYGDTDKPELRLVTCGGEFDPVAHSYKDNIVAFAQLEDD